VLLGLAPAAALAAFGFEEVGFAVTEADGGPSAQAGSHPFALTTTLRLNTAEGSGLEAPDGDLRHLRIDYPPGFVVMPAAMPSCSNADFIDIEGDENACPDSTAIGIGGVTASASGPIASGSGDFLDPAPVYRLTPVAGAVARIGFVAAGQPVEAELGLRDAPPYNGFVRVSDLTQAALFYSARISVWGSPADPAHDPDRGQCAFSGGICPVNVPATPLITAPRSCTGPLETRFEASSWQDPGQWIAATAASAGFAGCDKLGFSPQIDAQPTTDLADTPSGLDFSIDFHDEGLFNPDGIADSEARKLVVTLPEGMIANTAVIDGLDTCTPAQFEQETIGSEPGDGCLPGSEVGQIEVETPLLAGEILDGRVFAAEPDDPATPEPGTENPFDSPLAVYVVVKDPQLGILIKQAGEVEADPLSEQLTATFDDLPQLSLSHLGLHLHEGDDGPLLTPPECGEFVVAAAMSPWSNPDSPLLATSSFEIVAGPAGGPCPIGEEPDEEPPVDPGGDDLSPAPSATISATSPPSPSLSLPEPVKRRTCPKGKRRVGGKGRCVRRRCQPRRTGKRVVRRCVRPQGRKPS
jgi:hypothetical protein